MDYTFEYEKPLFLVRDMDSILLALKTEDPTVIEKLDELKGEYDLSTIFVCFGGAKSIDPKQLVVVDKMDEQTLREMIHTRLEVAGDEILKDENGESYTGRKASQEVLNETEVGEYFFTVEKEFLKKMQANFFENLWPPEPKKLTLT